MVIQVDPAFQKSNRKSRARQTKRQVKKVLMALGGLSTFIAVGLLIWLFWPGGSDDPGPIAEDGAPSEQEPGEAGLDGEENFVFVQTEASAEAGIVAAAAAFIDLRGDPMILRFEQSDSNAATKVPGPIELDVTRVGFPADDRLTIISDELVALETRFITTIPSSQEDLAFFQAQRNRGLLEIADQTPGVPVEREEPEVGGQGTLVTVDNDDESWGAYIDTGIEGDGSSQAVYVETVIENTTSVALMLREDQRKQLFNDIIVVVQTPRELEEVLTANELAEDQAGRVVAGAERILGEIDTLAPGSIVALRMRPGLSGNQLMQMSLYSVDGYLASVAQVGAGRYASSADPWYEDNLLNRTDTIRSTAVRTQEVRLLDAIYSAAIRNGVPTTLVGELIVMMSKRNDLDRFAAIGDKFTVVYATDPGEKGQGPGRILYAGVAGPSGEIKCYVTPDEGPSGYACFDFSVGSGGAGGALAGGLRVPVAGTKTSEFGPRMHPILRQLRDHNGVDWAAPTGTPVYAAGAGTVTRANFSDSYGYIAYIDHGNGIQTRYAHMDGFADAGKQGNVVRAGEQIGFVGTTGRSTGPHLHFEMWYNGNPVNPLSQGSVPSPSGGGAATTFSTGGAPGSGAVEALVNQIIRVESAGNANAKNSRSTATGLGQFISSTWIRMMQTYRPDLVQSMGRQQLLDLRTNPELSREMVRNLARENEAFLRQRGHSISPGRLYLAHFLGPAGANTALNANPGLTVLDVMGAAVVNANPFLRGKSIADLTAWADRKMRGASSAPAVGVGSYSAPVVIPAEVTSFKEAMDEIIKDL